MIKLASGKWLLEDWSNRRDVTFCRDRPDQDVVKLIIASSNASATGEPLGLAENTVTASNTCPLPTRYDGTWTRIYTDPTQGSFTETIHGTAAFVRSPLFPPEVDGQTSVHYDMESSSVTWSVTGSQPCSVYSGSGTDLPDSHTSFSGNTRLTLEDVSGRQGAADPEPEPYYYSIRAVRDPLQAPQYDIYDPCSDTHAPAGIILPYLYFGWPSSFDADTPTEELVKSADPTLLAGHKVGPNESGITVDDTWSFTGTN
jgi:hypothetical protein